MLRRVNAFLPPLRLFPPYLLIHKQSLPSRGLCPGPWLNQPRAPSGPPRLTSNPCAPPSGDGDTSCSIDPEADPEVEKFTFRSDPFGYATAPRLVVLRIDALGGSESKGRVWRV